MGNNYGGLAFREEIAKTEDKKIVAEKREPFQAGVLAGVTKAISEKVIDPMAVEKTDKTAEFLAGRRQVVCDALEEQVKKAFNNAWGVGKDCAWIRTGIQNDGTIFVIFGGVKEKPNKQKSCHTIMQDEQIERNRELRGIVYYEEGKDFEAGNREFVPDGGVLLFEGSAKGGKWAVADAFTGYENQTGIAAVSGASAGYTEGGFGNEFLVEAARATYLAGTMAEDHLDVVEGKLPAKEYERLFWTRSGISSDSFSAKELANIAHLLPEGIDKNTVEERGVLFKPFGKEDRESSIITAYSKEEGEWVAIDPWGVGTRGFGGTREEAIEDLVQGCADMGIINEIGTFYYKGKDGMRSVYTGAGKFEEIVEAVDSAAGAAGLVSGAAMFVQPEFVIPMLVAWGVNTLKRGYDAKEAHRHLNSSSEYAEAAVSSVVFLAFARVAVLKPVAKLAGAVEEAGEAAGGLSKLLSHPKAKERMFSVLLDLGFVSDIGVTKYYEWANHDRMKAVPELDCLYENAKNEGKLGQATGPSLLRSDGRPVIVNETERDVMANIKAALPGVENAYQAVSGSLWLNGEPAPFEEADSLIAFRAESVAKMRTSGELEKVAKALGVDVEQASWLYLTRGGPADSVEGTLDVPGGVRSAMDKIAITAAKKLTEAGFEFDANEMSENLLLQYMKGEIAWDWARGKIESQGSPEPYVPDYRNRPME